jgi:hypothetical protein
MKNLPKTFFIDIHTSTNEKHPNYLQAIKIFNTFNDNTFTGDMYRYYGRYIDNGTLIYDCFDNQLPNVEKIFNVDEFLTLTDNYEPRLGVVGCKELKALFIKLGLNPNGSNSRLAFDNGLFGDMVFQIYHLNVDKTKITFSSEKEKRNFRITKDINQFEGHIRKHLFKEEVKHLPKYFVIKWSNDPRWYTYIKYLNDTYNARFEGSLSSDYYGHDGTIKLKLGHGSCSTNALLTYFQNNPIVLTLDEFFEFEETKHLLNKNLNEKEEMEQLTVKKSDLGRIHDIACPNWKPRIDGLASRNLYSDSVELTQEEVNEMFRAATQSQCVVLEEIFGKQIKPLNFYNAQTIDFKVDGIKVFGNSNDSSTSAFIGLPGANYPYFILNDKYDWEIEGRMLKVKRK